MKEEFTNELILAFNRAWPDTMHEVMNEDSRNPYLSPDEIWEKMEERYESNRLKPSGSPG